MSVNAKERLKTSLRGGVASSVSERAETRTSQSMQAGGHIFALEDGWPGRPILSASVPA